MDTYILGKQYKVARVTSLTQKLIAMSKIKAGGRWCTATECAQEPGLVTSMYRTLSGENKSMSLKDILLTVSDTISMIAELQDNQVLVNELRLGLYMAQHGISNLRITYYNCAWALKILDGTLSIIMSELGSSVN